MPPWRVLLLYYTTALHNDLILKSLNQLNWSYRFFRLPACSVLWVFSGAWAVACYNCENVIISNFYCEIASFKLKFEQFTRNQQTETRKQSPSCVFIIIMKAARSSDMIAEE